VVANCGGDPASGCCRAETRATLPSRMVEIIEEHFMVSAFSDECGGCVVSQECEIAVAGRINDSDNDNWQGAPRKGPGIIDELNSNKFHAPPVKEICGSPMKSRRWSKESRTVEFDLVLYYSMVHHTCCTTPGTRTVVQYSSTSVVGIGVPGTSYKY
jgi:hypothetical protein